MDFKSMSTLKEACYQQGFRTIQFSQADADIALSLPMRVESRASLSIWYGIRAAGEFTQLAEADHYDICAKEMLPGQEELLLLLLPYMRDITIAARGKIASSRESTTNCLLDLNDMSLRTDIRVQSDSTADVSADLAPVHYQNTCHLMEALWGIPDNRFQFLYEMVQNPAFTLAAVPGTPANAVGDLDTPADYVHWLDTHPIDRTVLDQLFEGMPEGGNARDWVSGLTTPQQWLLHAAAIHSSDLTSDDTGRLLDASIYSLAANHQVTLPQQEIKRLFTNNINRSPQKLEGRLVLPINVYHLIRPANDRDDGPRQEAEQRLATCWLVGHVERLALRVADRTSTQSSRVRLRDGEGFRRFVNHINDRLMGWQGSAIKQEMAGYAAVLENVSNRLDEMLMRADTAQRPPQKPGDDLESLGQQGGNIL